MPAVPDAIKRIFLETFSARDMAEPLASFDAGAPGEEVRAFMKARAFEVVGVRREGLIVGFVDRETLGTGACGDNARPLDTLPIVSDTAPLFTVLLKLSEAPFLFVSMLGRVGGIVTRDDMQKPAVRMWLFGIVTLVEMRFCELIERHCPEESWRKFLSESRVQRAQALLEERKRRNQSLNVLDCLQFSDKGQVIARNEEIRRHTVFASRNQAEEAVKRLEHLRNDLAHAQDILTSDWDTIIQLCAFITQH